MDKKYIAEQQDLWQNNEFQIYRSLAKFWLDIDKTGNVKAENVDELQKAALTLIDQLNDITASAIQALNEQQATANNQ